MDYRYLYGAAAALPALILTLLLTPLVIRIAHHHNWYDDPDHRKIHDGDIPRLGGVAMFLSIITMWTVFIIFRSAISDRFRVVNFLRYLPFLGGAVIIHLVGLLDDFANLRARYKLIGQIAAALLVTGTGFYFQSLFIPFVGAHIILGPLWGILFTSLWIVGITNAINLVDGLDGLSGGFSAIVAVSLGIAAFRVGSYTAGFMAFLLFGSLLGFLKFNFPPAKIFMGDSGSLFLGYTLSVIPILAFRGVDAPSAFFIGATLLLVPVFDTLAAIIRRIRKKVPLQSPDKEHLHHKLLSLGFSTRQILATVYLSAGLCGGATILWAFFGRNGNNSILSSSFFVGAWVLVIGGFIVLDRVYKKKVGAHYYRQGPEEADAP